MFNATRPASTDLPTTGQLIRSTLIALAVAIVILVTIVLPSEYAIDPTGVGRTLGLVQMGEIKQQLAADAHADEQKAAANAQTALRPAVETTAGQDTQETAATQPTSVATMTSDEVSFTLKPSEGAEYKVTMREGAKATFSWAVAGGVVNYDLHGTANSGSETSYRKGRDVQTDSGELAAAFDGAHGWFWRNRGTQAVSITLRITGDYGELKRVK